MDKQDIRYTIAAVLFLVGFLLIVGAVGGLECDDFTYGQAAVRAAIGALIMTAGIPVSGDLPTGKRKNR